MSPSGLNRVVQSLPVLALLVFLAIPLVALRLFGYLFFASTTSTWAVIPALVLGLLCLLATRPFPRRRVVVIALAALYLLSVYSYGWADLRFRLSEGQSGNLDGVEALLILVFVLRCVVGGGSKQSRQPDSLT